MEIAPLCPYCNMVFLWAEVWMPNVKGTLCLTLMFCRKNTKLGLSKAHAWTLIAASFIPKIRILLVFLFKVSYVFHFMKSSLFKGSFAPTLFHHIALCSLYTCLGWGPYRIEFICALVMSLILRPLNPKLRPPESGSKGPWQGIPFSFKCALG